MYMNLNDNKNFRQYFFKIQDMISSVWLSFFLTLKNKGNYIVNLYDFAPFHPVFFLCCPKLVSEVTAKIRTGHTKQRELQIFYIKSLVTAVEGGLTLGYICRTVLIILKKGWAYAKDFFFFFSWIK